ncbi:hypothetical protein D9M68_772710 [compost metagenome]
MQHFHPGIVDEIDVMGVDDHPFAFAALNELLQVMAGAEKNRALHAQQRLLALLPELHPWLRGALEVEEQRGQHPGIDRRLQFQ